MYKWHIITGEYPPQPGGVSDYTRLVARELAKTGDEVDVWTSEHSQPACQDIGVRVHQLPGRFGPRAIAILDRAIAGAAGHRILLQYVPHAFGFKAMNLIFCCWLYARRRWAMTVMFHEVAFPRRTAQPLRHSLLGEITSVMAVLTARSAARIFVACASWETLLRPMLRSGRLITILPVPSTVPLVCDVDATKSIKSRYVSEGGVLVGHFGAYGADIRDYLAALLPELLQDHRVSVVLLGRANSGVCRALIDRFSEFTDRIQAIGELDTQQLSLHLSACDLMLQPYPDGISTRRSSAMAALSHGRAVVTTSGILTEPLWLTSRAVAITSHHDVRASVKTIIGLLNDGIERERLGRSARELYVERFDVRHTIAGMRAE